MKVYTNYIAPPKKKDGAVYNLNVNSQYIMNTDFSIIYINMMVIFTIFNIYIYIYIHNYIYIIDIYIKLPHQTPPSDSPDPPILTIFL